MKIITLLIAAILFSIICFSQIPNFNDNDYSFKVKGDKPTTIELIRHFMTFSGKDTSIRGWNINCELTNQRIGYGVGLFQFLVTVEKGKEEHNYLIWVSYNERYLLRIEIEEFDVSEL